MRILERMRRQELEQIIAVDDAATGLTGFIVIHDTTRGPAIGGCRFWTYENEESALDDAIKLAVAMTRKCALAGLNAGGGKAVFLDNPRVGDRAALMRAVGRYVESLSGRFYTSGDLGTHALDIRHMRETSRYVAVPDEKRLDLAGAVANGLLGGARATLAAAGLGRSLSGRTVLVQGLGAMGERVAALFAAEGARVLASEIDTRRGAEIAAKYGLELVDPEGIYDFEADLFCPCATGGTLTRETVPRLRVSGVVGASNNQLESPEIDGLLLARGIRYAPDYAVNCGAIVLATREAIERRFDTDDAIEQLAERIEGTVQRIFEVSDQSGAPPGAVADRLADDALLRPRSTERQWWPVH